MHRIQRTIATVLFFFLIAGGASAVEFFVVGADTVTPLIGELVTINIVMTNNSGDAVAGIGASVTGYGNNEFVSGTAVSNYLNTICVAPGTCFGGLDNLVAPTLTESAIGANGNRVQIALSAALSPVVGAGADQGLDGNVGTTMFSLTFVVRESALIEIGTSYQGDGVILSDGSNIQAQGAVFSWFVPEPSTAMLLGFGLVGLATRRRS